jgi:mycoredoxin
MTNTPEITLYGTTWCGTTRRARLLLDKYNIPYQWVDIDLDEEAAKFVEKVNHGNRSVPTIIWKDGSTSVEPSNEELARKLGVSLD